MTDKDKELARKILNKRADDTINGLYHYDSIIEIMQAYHKAKMKEVTDKDIERYLNKEQCLASGVLFRICMSVAKAMRDGEIKYVSRDNDC